MPTNPKIFLRDFGYAYRDIEYNVRRYGINTAKYMASHAINYTNIPLGYRIGIESAFGK